MSAPPDKPDRPGPARRPSEEPNPLALAGAAAELGVVVLVLTLGGWWLDSKLGTTPLCLLIGAGIGIIGGLYNLWRYARRFF